jgi:AI-2E family transporter
VFINLVVGNVLSPRIQGQAVRVPPMLIFLATIVGGELFGLSGVVLAVPTMAVLRVLFDFLRVRLRAEESLPDREPTSAPRADGPLAAALVPVTAAGAVLPPGRPPAVERLPRASSP